MAGLPPDPEFRLSGFERALLGVLKVPEAPQPPDGSPDSIRVFRAGRNYYLWSVLMWAMGALLAAFVAAGATVTHDVPPYALVMGVPARRTGWVCRCGEKLAGSGEVRADVSLTAAERGQAARAEKKRRPSVKRSMTCGRGVGT